MDNFNLIAYNLRGVDHKVSNNKAPSAEILDIDGIADLGSSNGKLFILRPSSMVKIEVSDTLEVLETITTKYKSQQLEDNRVLAVTLSKLYVSGRIFKEKKNYIAIYNHSFEEVMKEIFWFKNQGIYKFIETTGFRRSFQ